MLISRKFSTYIKHCTVITILISPLHLQFPNTQCNPGINMSTLSRTIKMVKYQITSSTLFTVVREGIPANTILRKRKLQGMLGACVHER